MIAILRYAESIIRKENYMNNIFPIIILIWIISAIVKAAKNGSENAGAGRKKSTVSKQSTAKQGNFLEVKEIRPAYRPDESNAAHREGTAKSQAAVEHTPNKSTKKEYIKKPDGKPANIAHRMYPGDQPPQGMKLVYCPYCNAENLIPTGGNREFHCYFCWVKLEGGSFL